MLFLLLAVVFNRARSSLIYPITYGLPPSLLPPTDGRTDGLGKKEDLSESRHGPIEIAVFVFQTPPLCSSLG